MRNTVVLMRGPQGSGKSTLARVLFPTSIILSSDALRVMLGGNSADQDTSKEVFSFINQALESRLLRGAPTVIDATFATSKGINEIKKIVDRYRARLIVIDFRVRDVEYLMGNIRRRAETFGLYVPKAVVEGTVSKLQSSDKWLYTSGIEVFTVTKEMYEKNFDDSVHLFFTKYGKNFWTKIVQTNGSAWVVGDVHGCYQTFLELMQKLANVGAKDVILAGDVIDRGYGSIEMLRFIKDNVELPESSKDINLHCVRGNHEHSFLMELTQNKVCRSVSREYTHRQLEQSTIMTKEGVIDLIIGHMPPSIILMKDGSCDSVLITHAGMDANASIDGCITFPISVSNRRTSIMFDDEHQWFRSFDMKQVHGHRHWEYVENIDKVKANIDGGAVYGGKLVAYNPFSGEVIRQDLVETTRYHKVA